MKFSKTEAQDRQSWLNMREQLWPDSIEEHTTTINKYFLGKAEFVDCTFVCERNDIIVGFIELYIRNYAEGSDNNKVPHIEGWYVNPDYHKQGIGAGLVLAAENWAKEKGYTELASDTDLENETSTAAHKALGFKEVGRAICFLKQL